MTKKLEPIANDAGEFIAYQFDCPGCKMAHEVYVRPYRNEQGATWVFNGSLSEPTFQPSIDVKWERGDGRDGCCHFFVTVGEIRFLSDCTHELAGKTAQMLEVG